MRPNVFEVWSQLGTTVRIPQPLLFFFFFLIVTFYIFNLSLTKSPTLWQCNSISLDYHLCQNNNSANNGILVQTQTARISWTSPLSFPIHQVQLLCQWFWLQTPSWEGTFYGDMRVPSVSYVDMKVQSTDKAIFDELGWERIAWTSRPTLLTQFNTLISVLPSLLCYITSWLTHFTTSLPPRNWLHIPMNAFSTFLCFKWIFYISSRLLARLTKHETLYMMLYPSNPIIHVLVQSFHLSKFRLCTMFFRQILKTNGKKAKDLKYKMNRYYVLISRKYSAALLAWDTQPWQISPSYAQQLAVSDLWCTLLISFWQNNLQQLHTISLSPLGYFSEIYELQAAVFLFCVQPTHQILRAVFRGKAMLYNGKFFHRGAPFIDSW